jgi:hypothetical protein
MLRNSSVVEQVVALQEGLISTELAEKLLDFNVIEV